MLEGESTVLGQTDINFFDDLSQAIRQIKGLSNGIVVYDHLYPLEFREIYITDISSEIAIMRGFEVGVEDFGGMVTWNTLKIEGYAKAVYK